MEDDGGNKSSFVDFASFQIVGVTQTRSHGAVIKSGAALTAGARKIEVEANEPDVPGIVIHRNGDTIERIEVVCPCGRHSEIQLQYETDA